MYVRRYRAIFPPRYGPMAFSKKAIWSYDPEKPAVRMAEALPCGSILFKSKKIAQSGK